MTAPKSERASESSDGLDAQESVRIARRRNAVIFVIIVALWLAADIASKAVLSPYGVGTTVAGPFLGLFDITLAHNTGGAWSLFGDAALPLGILSLLVCAAAILYLFVLAPSTDPLGAVGIALIVAGGIGNALDRFSVGYVIDFIRTTFMDFPIFNIADIGVTCGFVLFGLSLILTWRHRPSSSADPHDERASR